VKSVLLVEDHGSFRRALAFVLGREPDLEVVAQAGTLQQAREEIGAAPGIDVAVLDLGLPDGTGSDLIPDLRAANRGVRVLVLTVDISPNSRARALDAGADAVLGKDASIDEIVAAVKDMKGD
jgi:DNA-binding NarL/FixJ family response regulator